MSQGHYDPPAARVAYPEPGERVRWKWLLAPVAYAALNFLWILGWMWARGPEITGSVDFTITLEVILSIAKEGLYHGGLALLLTLMLSAAVPPVHFRHAFLCALVSAGALFCTGYLLELFGRPISTNGEQLVAILTTYMVSLLICGAIIRRAHALSTPS